MADYWMKLYVEILDDPKMALLPDRIWRRVIEIFLVAKKVNRDGHIPDTRQIAWMLRMDSNQLEDDLNQISPTGIIEREVNGWFIPKFQSRQAVTPPRERMAEMRKREKAKQYYGGVTQPLQSVTQSQSPEEEDRNKRIEGEKKQNSAFSSAYIPPCIEEKIYCIITNHPTIPSGEIDDTLNRIAKIKAHHGFDDNQTVEFLRPYWKEQKKRYPATTKTFWLDWALNEAIPAASNGKAAPVLSQRDQLLAMLAEAKAQEAKEAQDGES